MPLIDMAIVADDLTGALDSAAPFAARGAETKVAAEPNLDRLGAPMPAVLSVSTGSRHIPADDACTAVVETCAVLSRLEPGLWFKKIDSTLRGNVAAETLAAMAAAGLDHAIVCPAVPSQGRTVEGGVVMVEGVPLPATAFVRDAVSPASPQPLADQFRARDPSLAVATVAGDLPDPASGRGIWIADAKDDRDLVALAGWIAGRNGRSLAVGAAGLGRALANALFDQNRGSSLQKPDRPILFVIGSRAERTAAQVARLLSDHPDCQTIDAPAGRADARQIRRVNAAHDALIHIPRRADDPPASEVARNLGETVAQVVDSAGFRTVFLTGGDTAAAFLAEIDRPVVTLDGEVAPGVPIGHIELAGGPLRLITKAGGFGAESLLVELARQGGNGNR